MKTKILTIISAFTLLAGARGGTLQKDFRSTNNAVAADLVLITGNSAAETLNIPVDSLLSYTRISQLSLGTVGAAATVNLSLSTNLYVAAFSGATAIVNLPAAANATNGYWAAIDYTNSSGAGQIISWKVATVSTNLWRAEMGAATSTITNNAGAHGTLKFYVEVGRWERVSCEGDALQLRLGRDQLKFQFPRWIDGVGVTYPNTNIFTTNTFMVARFSGTAATNANFMRFATRVPKYFDTSVVPTASLTVHLSAADTGAHSYNIGFADVANSAVSIATVGTWINLAIAGDASGAYDDIESVSDVALTGWNGGLTAGHWWVIELNRAGAVDASTVASDFFELVIDYGISQ